MTQLPENIDAANPDDLNDATVKEHQLAHDGLHTLNNRIESAVLAAAAGQAIRRGAGTAFEAYTPGGGSVELIAKATLAAATASIDFAGIPQTYKHLRLVAEVRTTEAATMSHLVMRCNADVGANYDSTRLMYFTTVVSDRGNALTAARIGVVAGGTAAVDHQGVAVVELPNYSGTRWRKGYSAQGFTTSGDTTNDMFVGILGGRWRSTAAINQLTILSGTGDLATDSSVWLYGVKD